MASKHSCGHIANAIYKNCIPCIELFQHQINETISLEYIQSHNKLKKLYSEPIVPLKLAIELLHTSSCIETLLKMGAKLYPKVLIDGVQYKGLDVIKLLLIYGADPNVEVNVFELDDPEELCLEMEYKKVTGLMIVLDTYFFSMMKCEKEIKLLLKYGASTSFVNKRYFRKVLNETDNSEFCKKRIKNVKKMIKKIVGEEIKDPGFD